MIWHFHGKLASKQVLPDRKNSYLLDVDDWSVSEILQGSLGTLLDNATVSLNISHLDDTIDHLKDLGEKGKSILETTDGADELAFATYWPDANDGWGNLFSVTIGLCEDRFSRLHFDLDNAFFYVCPLWITGFGGFSVSATNPFSKQPTQDMFEVGHPMKFQDKMKIVIKAAERKNP